MRGLNENEIAQYLGLNNVEEIEILNNTLLKLYTLQLIHLDLVQIEFDHDTKSTKSVVRTQSATWWLSEHGEGFFDDYKKITGRSGIVIDIPYR